MNAESPLISIMVCVRNGMPHVMDAIDSVRALTYPNYELVIQDAASTDGTLEYLRSIAGIERISLRSEPDSGIGQGFNRAVQRCQGEIVGSVDADNRLEPGALELVARKFAEVPAAACVYGASNVIDAAGAFVHTWLPPAFDLLGLIDGTVVPPFAASFFSRRVCGEDLRFAEDFPIVADFELWLRLADRPIVRILDVLGDVRIGPMSSTYTQSTYDDQCSYKVLALQRFIDGNGQRLLLEALRRRAIAGLYLWGVESMGVIGGTSAKTDGYFEKAREAQLRSERFRSIVTKARPRVPASDAGLASELRECGIEYLDKGMPDSAIVYFDLLRHSGLGDPEIERRRAEAQAILDQRLRAAADHLIEEAISHARIEVSNILQPEVDRRDRMLAELQDERSRAVAERDRTIAGLNERIGELQRTLDAKVSEIVKRQFRRITG